MSSAFSAAFNLLNGNKVRIDSKNLSVFAVGRRPMADCFSVRCYHSGLFSDPVNMAIVPE